MALRRAVFCQGCRTWGDPAGHSCPAEDGDRTVVVPLAALRALVEDYREESALLSADRLIGAEVREELERVEGLIEALGVPELLED